MVYRYLEHATDAFIEVTANTLEEAFENAGLSVVDTIVDIKLVEEKMEKKIEVRGKDLNNLLYNWLEEIIIITITEGFVTKRFFVKLEKENGYKLEAILNGEEIDIKKHHFKVEIKAPTFHLMEIEQEDKRVVMRFLLDL
ncbi:MAG TPA: archease [Nitrosopumilaceae archaeon]|nr:archease [Nitrosopumilaceae archaeon]